MATKRKRGRYYLDDATVLPEMIVTPRGNDYLTDELGNPAVSIGALRDIDPNLRVMINRQLNDNQYRTMPTNAEANAIADAYAEQTAPGIGSLLNAAIGKPLTMADLTRYIGLLDSDNNIGFGHLFSNKNRGLFINNNPRGVFSKQIYDLNKGLGESVNLLGSLPLGYSFSKLINKGSKGVSKAYNYLSNWRPWVPNDANRYYRIVGEAGEPIKDAIETGVIRGPGLNPSARKALTDANATKGGITLVAKAHRYPMFSKGKVWQGSTSRAAGESKKPIVIRSKSDTGPIVWEESNIDFSHKGHAGIFRPSYNGDVNASPIDYFEYWEPKRFGYVRRDFPNSINVSNDANTIKVGATPYYYTDKGWSDKQVIVDDVLSGKQELEDWINNPTYRVAAEANRKEAEQLGLHYIPVWERSNYSKPLQVRVKQIKDQSIGGQSVEGDPTSLSYNVFSPLNAKDVVIHEGGHGRGIGAIERGLGTELTKKQHLYNRFKAQQVMDDTVEYPMTMSLFGNQVTDYTPIVNLPGEVAMNVRDVGRALGLKIGQPYPGADEALKIINSYPSTGPKSFIIPGLRKDADYLPYVWKALVGTQFGALPFILNKNE